MKSFFKPLLLFFFTFCSLFVAGQEQIDSIYLQKVYFKREVMIPMRDGTKLFTTIYAPKDSSQKHPVLMMRTPYSVSPYGAGRFSPRLYSTHWSNYIRLNYIIVMQDVRGRYMSEGGFMDVRPFNASKKGKETDEASDTYDAVDWLIKNVGGNNGKVGVFGISYPGFYATMAALSGHPAIKAVSPQAPVTDWFMGDDFHHNGAFALNDAFGFYYSFGKTRIAPTTKHVAGFKFPEKDHYSFHLKQGALKNYSKLIGDSVPFWYELMKHPNYDDWWKARDARRACKNITSAVLVVGGTFDAEDCYGAWNLYKAIEKQNPGTSNRIVMGPWFHGGWHRGEGAYLGNVRFGEKTAHYYQQQLEIPFFNHHLLSAGSDKKIAEATVFFSGENKWREYTQWPPASVENKPLYLQADQKLNFAKPAASKGFSSYRSDPMKPVPYTAAVHSGRTREYMSDDQRFAARRPDVLVFSTDVLESDITLAGTVIADLKVKLTTTDADFVVKIIDVFPDDFKYDSTVCCKGVEHEGEMAGYQMLVRGEIMRGRYRKSFEKPEAFVPGKVEQVRFELPDVAHTFKKGHKLMVQIQSTWFPLFDRNPQQFVNIYQCDDKDFVPCDIRVFHDAENPSSIILPVIATK
jgi:putative CocE/NonD family hydrolase